MAHHFRRQLNEPLLLNQIADAGTDLTWLTPGKKLGMGGARVHKGSDDCPRRQAAGWELASLRPMIWVPRLGSHRALPHLRRRHSFDAPLLGWTARRVAYMAQKGALFVPIVTAR